MCVLASRMRDNADGKKSCPNPALHSASLLGGDFGPVRVICAHRRMQWASTSNAKLMGEAKETTLGTCRNRRMIKQPAPQWTVVAIS